jgi:hypothetical protein
MAYCERGASLSPSIYAGIRGRSRTICASDAPIAGKRRSVIGNRGPSDAFALARTLLMCGSTSETTPANGPRKDPAS